MNDGSVQTKIYPSNDPAYNTEKDCRDAGQIIADGVQEQLSNNGKVYFNCHNLTREEIELVMGKTGSNL